MIDKVTISKHDGEYHLRAYNDGIRYAAADYFTDDLEDANDTRLHMLSNFREKSKSVLAQPIKQRVEFRVAGLPFSQFLYVEAPSMTAARKFINRESPGCMVLEIRPLASRFEVYALSDSNGNRI